jgi:hypothetical protein
VLVDGSSVGAVTSYTFSNVTANHRISATFASNTTSKKVTANLSATLASDTSSVTASAGANGTISASTPPVLAETGYYDHFNEGSYADTWTVAQSGMGKLAESGTLLNVAISKPVDECAYTNLTSIPRFSGENLIFEAGMSAEGAGGLFIRIKKDDDNFVELGINKETSVDIGIGSSDQGTYAQQTFDGMFDYSIKKEYGQKTFTIVKHGDQFETYMNGIRQGITVTNASIGDSNLAVELLNNSCPEDSKGLINYIDYVYISGTIGDGTLSDAVTLLSPKGGQTLKAGSLSLIEWTAPEQAVSFMVEYSPDNGSQWKVLDTGIQGMTYVWKLEALKDYSTYRIRVTGFDASGLIVGSDMSDRTFSVTH